MNRLTLYIAIIIIALASCDSNDGPVDSREDNPYGNGRIAKMEIWDTDIYTTKLSFLLEESIYNKSGDILRHAKYSSDTGELKNEASFSYVNGISVEMLKLIVPGGKETLVRNEYEFTPEGKVEQKKSFEADGMLKSVENYSYSPEGFLLESVVLLDSSVQTYSYSYTFDRKGEIATRTVMLNNMPLTRDSMYRDPQKDLLQIFTFNKEEKLQKSLTYIYNDNGDITSVVCHGPSKELIYRHIYQYIYHR